VGKFLNDGGKIDFPQRTLHYGVKNAANFELVIPNNLYLFFSKLYVMEFE